MNKNNEYSVDISPLMCFALLLITSLFILDVYMAARIVILKMFVSASLNLPGMSVTSKIWLLAGTTFVPAVLLFIAILVGKKWQRSQGWQGIDRSRSFVYRFELPMHIAFAVSLVVVSALAFIFFETLNELAGKEYFLLFDTVFFMNLIFLNIHILADWIIFLRHHRRAESY